MTPKDRAQAIIDHADSMEDIIHREVGQKMAEGIASIQAILDDVSNKLAALKAGYANGSLPRRGANSPAQSHPEPDR